MLAVIHRKSNLLFIILAGFFVTNALLAEFIGIKIFSLEGTIGVEPVAINLFGYSLSFNLTAGVLLWPVVFVMTDIINEYYGRKGVRLLSFMTVGLIIYAYLMIYMAIELVPADFWPESYAERGLPNAQLAYRLIFGQGLGIIIGSLVAFLIGQFVDVFVFHRIKRLTGEKGIWARATGSTLVSQFIDSFVVLAIAFYFVPMFSPNSGQQWPYQQVLAVGIVNYLYKFIVAVGLTPVIYLGHSLIDRYLGHEEAARLKSGAMEEA